MENVIHLKTFTKTKTFNDEGHYHKNAIQEENKTPVDTNSFLSVCRQTLSDEDYQELLCSILDEGYYEEAEDVIKELADTWHVILKGEKNGH